MAYTDKAFRFSVAGIPDPEQGLDDPQARYGIAGVTFPSSLVPLTWTLTDRLAAHYIPNPAVWDDYSIRAPIGGVPAAGLSDPVNRDGALSPTLSDFTVEFDGAIGSASDFTYEQRLSIAGMPQPGAGLDSFVSRGALGGLPAANEFTTVPLDSAGRLDATLGSFTTSFEGEFYLYDFFEVTYSITPVIVATEQPAAFGDIDITLGGFTTALEGQALPPDSTQGLVNSTLSGFSTAFDGTFTPAPARDGNFSLDIERFGVAYQGTFVPDLGVIGEISATLDGFSTSLAGTFEPFQTDGQSALTLDGFAFSGRGSFFDASTNVGAVNLALGGFSASLLGRSSDTFKIPVRRIIDDADIRSAVDNSDIRLIV